MSCGSQVLVDQAVRDGLGGSSTRAGRRGAAGAIARLTRGSRVWTLLRTPAADVSVVYNSFARVWSFFCARAGVGQADPVARATAVRGRRAAMHSTSANSLPGMSRGKGRELFSAGGRVRHSLREPNGRWH